VQPRSLFDSDDLPRSGGSPVALGASGPAAALSNQQKRFRKLIADIDAAKALLAGWRAFVPAYQERYAEEIEPLRRQLRERQVAMVELLDRAMDRDDLSKRHRAKIRDILASMLPELTAEIGTAELERLHDKYCDVTIEEARELARALAAEMIGDSPGDDGMDGDPAAARVDDSAQAGGEKTRGAARQDAAHEVRRDKVQQGASRSVRDVYRKLVSELHPDRELDPAERDRKTELIQQVNRAYDARDLLSLLELQLRIEQIDVAALGELPRERLRHYNLVFEEQLRELQRELTETIAPFSMMLGGPGRTVTPETVRRLVEHELAVMKAGARELDGDLKRFRDVRELKQSLGRHPLRRKGGRAAASDFDFA
jgi:hypothetical protein